MERLLRSVLALALCFLCVGVRSHPVAAEDTCPSFPPLKAADVQGYAWSGTVTASHATDAPDQDGLQHWAIVFSVDHVYGDGAPRDLPDGQVLEAGKPFRYPSTNCTHPGDLGLSVGKRYLLSTSHIGVHGSVSEEEIAWLLSGDRATMVNDYADGHPARVFAAATTLGEALALVAPNSLPPTDSEEPGPPPSAPAPLVLAGAALMGLLLWSLFLRQRRRSRRLAPTDALRRLTL